MKLTRVLTAAPALAVALACAYQALITFSHNHAFAALETEVGFWGRGNYQPTATTRQYTDNGLASLVAAAPKHPDYLSLRANQLAWESFWATDAVNKQNNAQKAAQIQYNALQNRPAHQREWLKLERYAGGMDNGAGLGALARARQQALQASAPALQ